MTTQRGTRGGPRMPRGVWLIGQIIVLSLVLAAVVTFASFKQYVEESPRFCHTCHDIAPEVTLWMESEHREVRCQQCHHARLEDGLRVLKVLLAGRTPADEHGPVDVNSCGRCHSSHDERWPSIANSVGHSVHTEKADLECTTCHGRQMHFREGLEEGCAGCHEEQSKVNVHEKNHCLTCHNFLSQDEKIRPQRRDCLRCHRNQERPVLVSADAPMFFPCPACHRPHDREAPLVSCDECHKAEELVGLHRQPGHEACDECHEPHGWMATRRHCASCHENLEVHHPDQSCARCHSFEAALGTGP